MQGSCSKQLVACLEFSDEPANRIVFSTTIHKTKKELKFLKNNNKGVNLCKQLLCGKLAHLSFHGFTYCTIHYFSLSNNVCLVCSCRSNQFNTNGCMLDLQWEGAMKLAGFPWETHRR